MKMTPHLDDKYRADSGDVFMTGTQALVRLPMAQMRRDASLGLNTGAFVTGYRGSPLGGFDQQLMRAKPFLDQAGVVFQPGVNEDLAATAIWGTQQVPLARSPNKDGVVGIWYGKGPGVDRCGDVFKHGNAAGTSLHGGVLCLAGDDHAAKSSTVPHQSDHAFMAAIMPVLFPSSIHEFIELGLLGIAMSRYSGCWVGYKVIADTVETSAVVTLGDELRGFVVPDDIELPEGGLNLRWPDPPLVQDERLQEHKGYAALAFARANNVDFTVFDAPHPRLGIVATGKAFEDVTQALTELGIHADEARDLGLRLYKVRMPWPLEPEGIRRFAEGLDEVLVVEERREVIEHQIKQQLFNWRADVRPRIIGKFDEKGRPVLPLSASLSIARVARAVAERVLAHEMEPGLRARITERLAYLQRRHDERVDHQAPIERQPWFCSGCPHNLSTKVPEGSTAMAGIGCHYMVQWMDRDTSTFTQMGGEGVPWSGIAPFCDEPHRFVNLGDGTYFHSGLLAVRASVAAGVNITYKVLYNDAVAMTGGQMVDGPLSPAIVTQQLHAEGVRPIWLVSDQPELYEPRELAPGTRLLHRDEFDAVQREARECTGTSGIVFVQTCAAEKRRRRKRGLMEDPALRLHIDTAICEGCGDCSVQSNCVSLEPVETVMGRKRRINQSSCNKDYSCLKGFCPSFVSVEGGQLRRPHVTPLDNLPALPEPVLPSLDSMDHRSWNIVVTGVGGTGVLTIGALLGMAAHVDGAASIVLDMAGLAQKGGAVLSHVRLARESSSITSPHVVSGAADLLIAADDVVAASKEATVLLDSARTRAVINTSTAPVAAFVQNRDLDFKQDAVTRLLHQHVANSSSFEAFGRAAERLAGDAIATNVLMLGFAWQRGFIPLSFQALDTAIELNAVAVTANRRAFALGRRLAADPVSLSESLQSESLQDEKTSSQERESLTLDALIDQRAEHLTSYQDAALAARYRGLVSRVRQRVASLDGLPDAEESLARVVAIQYARLLAPKDEYEVARLFSDPAFSQRLESTFDGDYRISLNLAPPLLARKGSDGRPVKRQFGPWILRVLRCLKRGKCVRGTAFDPFGYTAERRAERAWLSVFEEDVETVLDGLTADRLHAGGALLAVADQIRGFGPVKLEAMAAADLARAQALAQWRGEAIVQPLVRAA